MCMSLSLTRSTRILAKGVRSDQSNHSTMFSLYQWYSRGYNQDPRGEHHMIHIIQEVQQLLVFEMAFI